MEGSILIRLGGLSSFGLFNNNSLQAKIRGCNADDLMASPGVYLTPIG